MTLAHVAFFAFTALILVGGAVSLVKLLFFPAHALPPCGTTLRNPRASFDAGRVALLALGAPLSAHWRAYIDSLETGYNKKKLRAMLRDAWAVNDASSFFSRVADLMVRSGQPSRCFQRGVRGLSQSGEREHGRRCGRRGRRSGPAA